MATKPYSKMNKEELHKAATFFKVLDKVKDTAKDPSAPTNADYIVVLEDFKDAQEKSNEDIVEEDKSKGKFKKATPMEIEADLMRKIMVTVHDNDNTRSTEEELEGMLVSIGWGNIMTGGITSNVRIDGVPTYVPRGCLLAMETMTVPVNRKDATDRTKRRFNIAEVEGWTEEELQAHAKAQKLKKL